MLMTHGTGSGKNPPVDDEEPASERERIAFRRGVLGMPDELFDSIATYGGDTRQKMLRNWIEIGDSGRAAYLQYLSRAWTQRGLRKRAELAAGQLLDPSRGFNIPPGATGAMF